LRLLLALTVQLVVPLTHWVLVFKPLVSLATLVISLLLGPLNVLSVPLVNIRLLLDLLVAIHALKEPSLPLLVLIPLPYVKIVLEARTRPLRVLRTLPSVFPALLVLTQLSMVLRVVLIAPLVVLVNGPPLLVLQIPPSASLVRGELIRRKQ